MRPQHQHSVNVQAFLTPYTLTHASKLKVLTQDAVWPILRRPYLPLCCWVQSVPSSSPSGPTVELGVTGCLSGEAACMCKCVCMPERKRASGCCMGVCPAVCVCVCVCVYVCVDAYRNAMYGAGCVSGIFYEICDG